MKMYKKTGFYSLAIIALMMLGCKESSKEKEAEKEAEKQEATIETVEEVATITIEKLESSPEYKTASFELKSPDTSKQLPSGEVNFEFDVQNYELGAQTKGPNASLLANSGKGQHIHFILNNQPYSAHYESTFVKEIPNGTHHLVAFLSRSFHESVKNENSVVVKQLQVGENDKDAKGLDMNSPTLIYSRPKGKYVGKDTENILLDFFVLNTTLSEDSNKVRATINDEEFMITEWVPHIIKGLPMGEVIIKLELLDAKGSLIPGPFNEVTRTVNLEE